MPPTPELNLLHGNILSTKTDISTVDYFFENHCTNVAFMHIKNLLNNLQDTSPPAWSLSTNMQILTSLPWCSEAFASISQIS